MRAISLHPDVVVAWSRVWQTTCTLVRGPEGDVPGHPAAGDPRRAATGAGATGAPRSGGARGHEAFLIDSPVFPDELGLLPALAEQASFEVAGVLATHGDWDHLLGRIAFPQAPLGCAPTTAARLSAHPGDAQRELRAFDDEHYVDGRAPLALGSVQALEVPGRLEVGSGELELHPTAGHTGDGMAVVIPWARVLVAGDYLSAVEIPMLGAAGSTGEYLETLTRLRTLVECADHVVTGHGPVLAPADALGILAADEAYLAALGELGAAAPLPRAQRSPAQRAVHERNVAALAAAAGS